MANMDLLLAPFGSALQVFDTPIKADSVSRIREPVSDDNPLLDNFHHARAILGLGLYITCGVRTDCSFPALALSQYIVNHLTKYVWNALLRMERVSRQQRFQAARLAILRYWQEERVIKLLKLGTEDMRADILSKPVNPSEKFGPNQRLLLTGSVDLPPPPRVSSHFPLADVPETSPAVLPDSTATRHTQGYCDTWSPSQMSLWGRCYWCPRGLASMHSLTCF